VYSKFESGILSVIKNLAQLNEEPTMIVEEMIDSAVAEYKIKLLAHCSEAAESPLAIASSAPVVSGLHEAANAASKAALGAYVESKDESRDVIRVGEDEFRVKCPQRLRTRYVALIPEDLAPTFKRRFEEELSAAEPSSAKARTRPQRGTTSTPAKCSSAMMAPEPRSGRWATTPGHASSPRAAAQTSKSNRFSSSATGRE